MKQKMNGYECDWVSRYSRRILSWARGSSKFLKKQMNRRRRYEGKRIDLDE